MNHFDDGLKAIEGVDIKTERRLILLLAVCCVGLVLAVRVVAGWIV
jgi:hypothetical protein